MHKIVEGSQVEELHTGATSAVLRCAKARGVGSGITAASSEAATTKRRASCSPSGTRIQAI